MAKKTSKKTKIKTPAGPPAPQSREECAVAIAEYGRVQADRQRTLDEMNEKIRAVTQDYEAELETFDESLKLRHLAIQTWCEANRVGLAEDNGVKYIQLTTGRVEWRKAPDKITAPNKPENLDTVLKMLKEKHLERFIRVKEEINKEAMLAEKTPVPEEGSKPAKPGLLVLIHGIPGLSLVQGKEEFHVKPLEIDPS